MRSLRHCRCAGLQLRSEVLRWQISVPATARWEYQEKKKPKRSILKPPPPNCIDPSKKGFSGRGLTPALGAAGSPGLPWSPWNSSIRRLYMEISPPRLRTRTQTRRCWRWEQL